jgi:hypothetical protein
MNRSKLLALAIVVVVVGTCHKGARAGEHFDHFVDEVHIGFWRNMCWPKPFVYPDRKAAFAPMDIMANNGWRRNNLLGAHHFEAQTASLNESGKLRVQWILTQAPIHRRTIFVERSFESPVETGRRIEAAQQYAATVSPEGTIQVVDTHIKAEGRSAVDVDSTNVRFRESAPAPILPEASASTTGE